MDKSKIINNILSEWAMRSHDGLVSGYSTHENIKVLSEVLKDRGLSDNEVASVMIKLFNRK